MKKTNKRLIFIIATILLTTLIFLLKDPIAALLSKKSPQPFTSIKKEVINNLTVVNNQIKTELYKKNGAWFLKKDNVEFAADQARIDAILDNVLGLKKESVISTNPKNHDELGISDNNQIVFQAKDKTYHLFIGKSASINNNYLRVNNENEVFEQTGFDTVFTPDDYRDLNVRYISDETNVSLVKISSINNKVQLEKKKEGWFVNNKKAKQDRVDFFLNDLKTLKAQDILKEGDVNLTNYAKELSILVKDKGQEKTADFFSKDKNTTYLKVSGSSVVFEVAKINADSFDKQEKDFLE